MLSPNRTLRIRTSPPSVLVVIAVVLASCGSETEATPFVQVRDTGKIFNPDHLNAIRFKESKEYSVETLPGATDAIFGFWTIKNGSILDFEVRFYPTAADAELMGTAPADEGTGDDAILDEESASFKDGVKDRRTIIGSGEGGGGRSGIGPKYADYVIYNNLVILCPGGQVEQSHERCCEFIEALEAS